MQGSAGSALASPAGGRSPRNRPSRRQGCPSARIEGCQRPCSLQEGRRSPSRRLMRRIRRPRSVRKRSARRCSSPDCRARPARGRARSPRRASPEPASPRRRRRRDPSEGESATPRRLRRRRPAEGWRRNCRRSRNRPRGCAPRRRRRCDPRVPKRHMTATLPTLRATTGHSGRCAAQGGSLIPEGPDAPEHRRTGGCGLLRPMSRRPRPRPCGSPRTSAPRARSPRYVGSSHGRRPTWRRKDP